MIAADRDALICDLAETYGVLDMRAIPVPLLATLACGLRENARIKMKLSGSKANPLDLMVAAAVDRLSILMWQNTKDGADGRNKPKSIVALLLGEQEEEKELQGFDTAEEFEAAWIRTTGVAHGG